MSRALRQNIADFQSLLWVLNIAAVVTFGLSYYLSIRNGDIYWPYIFVSAAINYDPARAVGGFGLGVIALVQTFLIGGRAAYLCQYRMDPRVAQIHRRSLFCAAVFVISLIGVGATPFLLSKVIHLIFATALFVCGIPMIFLFVYVDRHTLYCDSRPVVMYVRMGMVVATIGSILGLGGFILFLPGVASICEIMAVLLFIGFINSYMAELWDWNISISIEKKVFDPVREDSALSPGARTSERSDSVDTVDHFKSVAMCGG